MCVAIISDKDYKFNIKFLIYMDGRNFSINVEEYIMNQWTGGHTKEFIINKIKNIKNYKIINNEEIFYNNSIIRLDNFTVGEFINILVESEYFNFFIDDKIHCIKYKEI